MSTLFDAILDHSLEVHNHQPVKDLCQIKNSSTSNSLTIKYAEKKNKTEI